MAETNIHFGVAFFDSDLKPVTHNVTSIWVDMQTLEVRVVIEKGTNVEQVTMSMHQAQEIGFIDVKKLKPFIKK